MAINTPTEEYWWLYAAVGVASILFGLFALLYPHLTLGLLVIFFGIFAIIDGVLSLIDMFRRMGRHETWWPALIIGIIGIAAGIYVLTNPVTAAGILIWVIAFWAIFIGMMEIFAGFATGQLLLVVVGLLTMLFGFIILANPVPGTLALVMVIGVFYIVRGIVLIVQSFHLPASTPTAF